MLDSNHNSHAASPAPENERKRSKAKRGADSVDPLYSPKKVAAAIGVSESSLKRWCDAGVVNAVKTAGGHRKITRSEVVAFARIKNYKLRDPLSIGLPDIRTVEFTNIDQARVSFLTAMLEADAISAKKILCSLFISGHNIAEIFDKTIAPVFLQIGELWKCGDIEVYQERMATQICHESLLELRTVIPQVAATAPVAIGASLEGNEYQLATLGIELCLKNFGWSATSLGANIPMSSLLQAATDLQPSMIWISATHIDDPESFVSKLNVFSNSVTEATKVVVGGRAIDRTIRENIRSAHYCENLAQLVMLARAPEVTSRREPDYKN